MENPFVDLDLCIVLVILVNAFAVLDPVSACGTYKKHTTSSAFNFYEFHIFAAICCRALYCKFTSVYVFSCVVTFSHCQFLLKISARILPERFQCCQILLNSSVPSAPPPKFPLSKSRRLCQLWSNP